MKNIFLTLALTLMSSSVFANTYSYKCYSYYWNGYRDNGTMVLEVSKQEAAADIQEVSWDENLGGQLDPKYKSKGSLKFVKFGYNLILEEALVYGGKTLKDGSLGGIARVEGQAEGGFYQYKFICKR